MENLADPVKEFITRRMARHDPLWRIAASVQANFNIEVGVAQILACGNDQDGAATQSGLLQNDESLQRATDEVTNSDGERMAGGAILAGTDACDTLPVSIEIELDEGSMAIFEERKAKLLAREGYIPPEEPIPTLTGPLQNQESRPAATRLTDEVKTFIVKALAYYDTPSQVVEAVKVTFGLEISRQLVHTYDPACSQPPAQRWLELHAATRQAFLADIAEIGIAHKSVRLRMLDRFARNAEARNFPFHAAEFMEQAAKECGGIYEKRWKKASRQDPAD
jgi:hypothetical protein